MWPSRSNMISWLVSETAYNSLWTIGIIVNMRLKTLEVEERIRGCHMLQLSGISSGLKDSNSTQMASKEEPKKVLFLILIFFFSKKVLCLGRLGFIFLLLLDQKWVNRGRKEAHEASEKICLTKQRTCYSQRRERTYFWKRLMIVNWRTF